MDRVNGILDEKGRITIPKDLRDRLGLEPGNKVIFSVIKNTFLIRKAISPSEFIQIVEGISEQIVNHKDTPVKFEKLF